MGRQRGVLNKRMVKRAAEQDFSGDANALLQWVVSRAAKPDRILRAFDALDDAAYLRMLLEFAKPLAEKKSRVSVDQASEIRAMLGGLLDDAISDEDGEGLSK